MPVQLGTVLKTHNLIYNETIKKAKAHYENKPVAQLKEDPKRFWNYTRHFTRTSATVDILEHHGSKTSDDRQKANILNNYFVSVLTEEPAMDGYEDQSSTHQHIVDTINLSPDYVKKKML